jgi:hypothetical protein
VGSVEESLLGGGEEDATDSSSCTEPVIDVDLDTLASPPSTSATLEAELAAVSATDVDATEPPASHFHSHAPVDLMSATAAANAGGGAGQHAAMSGASAGGGSSESIRVVVRIRPLNKAENGRGYNKTERKKQSLTFGLLNSNLKTLKEFRWCGVEGGGMHVLHPWSKGSVRTSDKRVPFVEP